MFASIAFCCVLLAGNQSSFYAGSDSRIADSVDVLSLHGFLQVKFRVRGSVVQLLARDTTGGVHPVLSDRISWDSVSRSMGITISLRNGSDFRLLEPRLSLQGVKLGALGKERRPKGNSGISKSWTVATKDSTHGWYNGERSWVAYARPHEQVGVQEVTLVIPREVSDFDLRIEAIGVVAIAVPAVAPPVVRLSRGDTAFVAGSSGRMSRSLLRVKFRGSASREQKQMAIDLVDGEVVGGSLGAYIIRVNVPRDSVGAGPIVHALQIIRKSSSVEIASIVHFEPPRVPAAESEESIVK